MADERSSATTVVHEALASERTRELEDERALLMAVIESVPAGLLLVNRDGQPVLANGEAFRMTGREPGDICAFDDWRDAVTHRVAGRPVRREEWPISRTLATGELVSSERYEVEVHGRPRIFEISTTPIIPASGALTGVLAVFRDVSRRERAERAERDFVTNAAHELQSPLAAIVSAIEVLQAGAKDGPERDVFLEHIERAADRLARLVRALLILARTQSQLEAPRDELVALRPLLEEVGAGLHLSPSVTLEIDCPDDLAVVSNRPLVEQALVNLTENAAKRTATGRVVLKARAGAASNVELIVADTGPGIPASAQSRIFERFYRVEETGSEGFGLGLAIVHSVAEALGGGLELSSAPDAGTSVTLRIPNAASMVTA